MKPKKTFSAYILLIGVMSLSIVGGVLAFQIFSAATKSQLSEKQVTALKPIEGTINQTTIDNLEKRTKITDDDIYATETVPVITPLVTPDVTPAITPDITLTDIESSPSAEQTPQL